METILHGEIAFGEICCCEFSYPSEPNIVVSHELRTMTGFLYYVFYLFSWSAIQNIYEISPLEIWPRKVFAWYFQSVTFALHFILGKFTLRNSIGGKSVITRGKSRQDYARFAAIETIIHVIFSRRFIFNIKKFSIATGI